jgi:lysophospholipid acyltransferase (LPLAT)-like uncharacterized protein
MNLEILPEERVSKRRLTPVRRAVNSCLVPLGLVLLRFWWRSCRIVRVEGAEHIDEALAAGVSIIPCYWHEHELFCAYHLLQQIPRGLRLGFLISPSVDGEVPAAIATRLGAQVIRGSSTRTGAKALRDYYQLLARDNVSPVITPDGPTGPRQVFKPGALTLAQISGRKILPLAFAASRAWRFGWDQFVLPVPFCRIALAIGPAIAVSQATKLLDSAVLASQIGVIEAELARLQKVAKSSL